MLKDPPSRQAARERVIGITGKRGFVAETAMRWRWSGMSWEVMEREVSVRRRKALALVAWCLNPRAVCVSSQIASSVQA